MYKKYFIAASSILFLVLFNLGYVFHDLLLGDWFHQQEAEIAREEYIIPLIALAFLIYSVLLGYLFPMFRLYFSESPLLSTALRFGILMGFMWDGLQGGLIEVATFRMPFVVFVVDSGYHALVEGSVGGLILAFVWKRWPPHPQASA